MYVDCSCSSFYICFRNLKTIFGENWLHIVENIFFDFCAKIFPKPGTYDFSLVTFNFESGHCFDNTKNIIF